MATARACTRRCPSTCIRCSAGAWSTGCWRRPVRSGLRRSSWSPRPRRRTRFEGIEVAVQEHPLGTGDAVRSARAAVGALGRGAGPVGDTPLLTSALLEQLLATHRDREAAATVLSFRPDDIRSYGRIVRGPDGDLEAIVEAVDATPEQLEIGEANSSIYVFRAESALAGARPADARQRAGRALPDGCGARPRRERSSRGRPRRGRPRRDCGCEHAGRARRRRRPAARSGQHAHMLAGVTIVDPATTWIEPSRDDRARHHRAPVHGAAWNHAESRPAPRSARTRLSSTRRSAPGAHVGPFCYLRPGTVLAASAKAGSFVELKNARIGEEAKVPHLSYVGDAESRRPDERRGRLDHGQLPHGSGGPKVGR